MSFEMQQDSSSSLWWHRDGFGRREQFSLDHDHEMFFSPRDGRLKPLKVQRADKLKNITPYLFRVVADMTTKDYGTGALIWLPWSIAVMALLCWPSRLEGKIRNGGYYDPVRYQHWGYARAARNPGEAMIDQDQEAQPLLVGPDDLESGKTPHHAETEITPRSNGRLVPSRFQANTPISSESSGISRIGSTDSGIIKRLLFPRYLCFVKGVAQGDAPFVKLKVADWMAMPGNTSQPSYVFVSYTRVQFLNDTTAQERGYAHLNTQQTLITFAVAAAKAAGVEAFWIDYECVGDDRYMDVNDKTQADAFRICDIMRTAHSMAIILGPSLSDPNEPTTPEAQRRWFSVWGSRLWTVPEALLCPTEHRITVYTDGLPVANLAKRNLAELAWPDDAGDMRQLIDHYEATIQLTPIELLTTALRVMQRRMEGTTPLNAGDVSYCLMGLLRRRPHVNTQDSDFEAFARLSFANDSDQLMERLLCMMPTHPTTPWHDIRDAYGIQLWDIEPSCQIAGIVDNRTVLLDGVHGATIRWKKINKVAFFKRETWPRAIMRAIVRSMAIWIVFAFSMLAVGPAIGWALPAVIFVLVFIFGLITPPLIWRLYRGKLWETSAYFFGMEGLPNLDEVERNMFGFHNGRLRWSTCGSTLSRHHVVQQPYSAAERVAHEPHTKGEVPVSATGQALKLYTIIDSFSLTATAFYAERPPSVVMVCGREGGMQRAVLCSYEWRSQTYVRETVLRMKTKVLDRMSRVDQFRFCLTRQGWNAAGCKNDVVVQDKVEAVEMI